MNQSPDLNRFCMTSEGGVYYGLPLSGVPDVHDLIVSGDLAKALQLCSKGEGDRELDEGRGDTRNPSIPIPPYLRKSKTWSGHPIRKRLKFQGLDISIENPAGSYREGVDTDGKPWRSLLHFDYGYIRGTTGIDKDHIDCFIGPHKDSSRVFVIHQQNVKTRAYDEDKVMLGWRTKKKAVRDYLKNYDRTDMLMGTTAMSMADFKVKAAATVKKPRMIKARVRAHIRRTRSGKIVPVREHEDSRRRKELEIKIYHRVSDAFKRASSKVPIYKTPSNEYPGRILRATRDELNKEFAKEFPKGPVTYHQLYRSLFSDRMKTGMDSWDYITGLITKKLVNLQMKKSTVRAHTRKTSQGKVVHVQQHQTSKTKKPSPEKQTVVRDVGEKIGGARKDLWKDLSTARITKDVLQQMEKTPEEAHRHIRKKALLLPLPPDNEAQANGVNSEAYYLLKQAVRNIPERPGDSPEERENYIIVLKRINGLIRNAKTVDDILGFLADEVDQMHSNLDKHKGNMEYQISHAMMDKKDVRSEYLASLAIREKKERFKQSPFMVLARDVAKDILHLAGSLTYGRKADDPAMLAKFKAGIMEMKKKSKKRKVSDSLLLGQKWLHFVLASANLKSRMQEGGRTDAEFRMVNDLRKYDATRSGPYELSTKLYREMERYDYDAEKTIKPKGKGGFERDVAEKVTRKGGARFKARKPEDLLKEFGIRGVEFGNYMDEASGEYHIQSAGAALLDLANILGLSSKHMSMRGRLALAFGARGKGKFAAHYEPLKEVINMTKWRGGGALAHEWAHFLDNVLAGKVTGAKTEYAAGQAVSRRQQQDIPEAIRAEYFGVMKAIHQGDGKGQTIKREAPISPHNNMKNRYGVVNTVIRSMLPKKDRNELYHTPKLDPKKVYAKTVAALGNTGYGRTLHDRATMIKVASDIARRTGKEFTIEVETTIRGSQFAYDSALLGESWNRPHELFARAFESYIEDKLSSKGMANTYLVSGTRSERTRYIKFVNGLPSFYNPYPTGNDRIAINKAIDKLMVKIRGNRSLLKAIQRVLIKSTVRAHPRRMKSGRIVRVRQYEDTRTRKPREKKPRQFKGMSIVNVGAVPTGAIKIPGRTISDAGDVAGIFKGMKDEAREKYWVVGTDEGGKIVSVELHSMGGIGSAQIDPRVVVSVLRANKAEKYWGIHNHPSGQGLPSDPDFKITARIKELAKKFNIRYQGDVIIHGGKDTYTVFSRAIIPVGESQTATREKQRPDEKDWKEHPISELKVTGRGKAPSGMPLKIGGPDDAAKIGKWIQDKYGAGVWILCLNGANQIAGFYLLGDNRIGEPSTRASYGKAILKHMMDTGSVACITVGTHGNKLEMSKYHSVMEAEFESTDYKVLDSIFATDEGYYSGSDSRYTKVAKSILIKSRIKAKKVSQ